MTTLGSKWVGDLAALPASMGGAQIVSAQPDLAARTVAAVRELARGGVDFRALVSEHNERQGGPVPPPPPPPVGAPSLYSGAGVQVYTWQNFDGNAAARARGAGFRWVAGLEHEGTREPVPGGRPPAYRRAEWRNAGLVYGAYGYCKGDPVAVAEAANGVIVDSGAEFYIANAEGDVPAAFDGPFLKRFRELQPTLPLGLSCGPDDPRAWPYWVAAKATPTFQAYYNKNKAVTPAECAFKAQQHGWQAADSKPTLGVFQGEGQTTVPPPRYVQLLNDAGSYGFSIWAAEHVLPEDWAVYASAIAAGARTVTADVGQPRLFDPGASLKLTLADKFLVPPFSVLEARAGYWQDRKRDWVNLGIKAELGREAELLYGSEEGMGRRSGSGVGEDVAYRRDRDHAVPLLMEAYGLTEEEAVARYYEQEAARTDRKGGVLPPEQAQRGVGSVSSRDSLSRGGGGLGNAAGRKAAYDGMASGEGRGDRLLSGATPREYTREQAPPTAAAIEDALGQRISATEAPATYGKVQQYDTSKGENAWGGSGTSIFDPVLCELAYRWYSPAGGRVLDPFAGGSVRGIVAAHLGREYVGIDLRAEQVAANEEQARNIGAKFQWPHPPRWVEGDCLDVLRETKLPGADLLFSCPPYYDLEQYSEDPRDLSNAGSYERFRELHTLAIQLACTHLKPDRFAVWVIGEVRAKAGHYHGLVPDTIRAFEAAGLKFYNEGILVTSVGSLPIRTSRLFGPGRKLGKTHQNVLVFIKGDWRKAAAACPMPAEVAIEYGGATWDATGTVSTEDEVVHFTGVEPGT